MHSDKTALAMVGAAEWIRMAKLVQTRNRKHGKTNVTNGNAVLVGWTS
jgi:hypothetical protein